LMDGYNNLILKCLYPLGHAFVYFKRRFSIL